MKRYLAIFTMLIIFAVGIVQAQPPATPPAGMPGPAMDEFPMPPNMGARLGLTEAQMDQIADLRLEMQKQVLPLRSELMSKRNELKLLLTADKPDMGKIKAKLKEIGDLRVQISTLWAQHLLKVRELLNDTQKKKFDSMILNGKGMRGMPHHRPGHPHPHGKPPMGKRGMMR
jgi:Spy/CpxP family protein refolding chaperone